MWGWKIDCVFLSARNIDELYVQDFLECMMCSTPAFSFCTYCCFLCLTRRSFVSIIAGRRIYQTLMNCGMHRRVLAYHPST